MKENKLNFIDDDSNKDNSFDRNFLRNKIFPLLENRWHNFPQRFTNMSSIIRDRNTNYTDLFFERPEQEIMRKRT